MRRSICLCEPTTAKAGEVRDWKFTFTTAVALPKGTLLKFDLLSQGRPIDWPIPSVALKGKKKGISLEVPKGQWVGGKRATSSAGTFSSAFEFILPKDVKVGESLHFHIHDGAAQNFSQRRKAFHLYIDPKGKGDYKDPEIFTMDIRGGPLQTIRIIAPSLVAKNARFDVRIRFEDVYGNLTKDTSEGAFIELFYENLRENLSWKLFIPETGFINLPNLYFNEVGVFRIRLRHSQTNEIFLSPPIRCLPAITKEIFWGFLHGESERVDALENADTCMRLLKDEKSIQFFASSPFESSEELTNELWKTLSTHIADINSEGQLITFLGFQCTSESSKEGLRHFIYAKDNKPLLRQKGIKISSFKKLYKSYSPKEFISIPCFTMARGIHNTFEDFDPEFERVVEIYNSWGSSECLSEEGNPRPIIAENGDKDAFMETKEGSIREALNRNCRFGFVAGGLDDRAIYSKLFDTSQVQYSEGLTAIFSAEISREAFFLALYQRACYATTGAHIPLNFSIAQMPMGSELSTKLKPGLALNRHITAFVSGTSKIEKVEIIRNGEIFHTAYPDSLDYELILDDMVPLEEIALRSPDERPHFVYYYLRVFQTDGHLAWSSPIWIDLPDMNVDKKIKKKTGGSKNYTETS
jgi:hypothetical protein